MPFGLERGVRVGRGGAGIVKHRRSKLSYIVIGGFPLRPKLINDVYHVTVTM